MAKTILFVYGSLKRDQINHSLLLEQEYLGDVATKPRYRILDLGRYPGLVRVAAAGLAVRGELWAVDPERLQALDEFEQAEGLWRRGPVEVPGRADVEAYFWVGAVPEGVRSGIAWPLEK